jgi:cellulose synthase/poly-beta-1,6-N-acetylglucosamine synthase-like glycosyltransferase/exo-beta-1,3-glucanase (GH17 family)
MRFVALIVALVACVHLGLWVLFRDHADAPNINGKLSSVSYAPNRGSDDPNSAPVPNVSDIRADLKVLAPYTRTIRTYSSTCGGESIPAIANEFGLRVSLGAWIGAEPKKDAPDCWNTKDSASKRSKNVRELSRVIELAKRHRNVDSIIVGNEVLYRGETIFIDDTRLFPKEELKARRLANGELDGSGLSEEEQKRIGEAAGDAAAEKRIRERINVERLIKVIQRVKRETHLPVTTGEIWTKYRDYPELAHAVDYIAAHVLPYWEKIDEGAAVGFTISAYNELRERYPGKRVVIAEFGWPSAGYNRGDADPGRGAQAVILRDFVARAESQGIDYNIIEAFDVKWKVSEGGVGPYWGLFDANRQLKFTWSGPVASADHWKLATLALLIGVLLSLPLLAMRDASLGQALLRSGAANVVGAWTAIVFAFWHGHYFVWGAAFALTLGLILLVPMIVIALSRLEEIAAIAFGRKPMRLIASPPLAPESYAPKVSIHIPAYCEPAEMLKATLDSVARLNYPNFECVVIINNTPDPAFWRPVEEHCRELGERFKFVREENLMGFKAGALRLALAHTAADAEIIGVIDADYVVHPDWLKDLAPVFADARVGLVQAPQDHRDGSRSLMHNAMNGEYAGFFDIGMVQRNEVNAIIVHGTMCLIRRTALEQAGGWSSDTICEDTDLGLTILELGWIAQYTSRRYGHGLLPDSFQQFKRQRYRWAYGGFQIVKKHWRRFLPGASRLGREQKREFTFGWLNWLGAESIGVLVALLNLIWVPFVAVLGIAIPDKILTLPILAAFAVSLLHFIALYRLRVAIPAGQRFGAVLAAMSLQWTVARAVAVGFVKDHLPFVRTAKGGWARRGADFPAFWEAVIGTLLIGSAIFLHATNYERVREIDLFALVLVVQALPFLASVALAALESSRANDFATWRNLETKVVNLLPQMQRDRHVAKASVADNQLEKAA